MYKIPFANRVVREKNLTSHVVDASYSQYCPNTDRQVVVPSTGLQFAEDQTEKEEG